MALPQAKKPDLDWDTVSFREILAEPVRNGVYKPAEFHGRGYPIVNMGELFAHEFISDQAMKRVELTDAEIAKSALEEGDLLFARRSFVLAGAGKCSIVSAPIERMTFESSLIRARVDKRLADPLFYYYMFRSPAGRDLMASIAVRTAVSGITGQDLMSLRVPFPELRTQSVIAQVLKRYDDLLRVNKRRISLLADVVRLIYTEWFVQFRFPGDEAIQLVDGPLGLVPQGWEVTTVGAALKTVGGGTPSTKSAEYWDDGSINWYTPSDLTSAAAMFVFESEKRITSEGLRGSSATLFPAYSVMLTSRATIGVIGVNTTEACTNQGFITCIPSDRLTYSQLYFWLERNRERILSLATGATYREISRSTFRSMPILVPPATVASVYSTVVSPMLEQIETLQRENRVLRETWAFLLQHLVSGVVDSARLRQRAESAA